MKPRKSTSAKDNEAIRARVLRGIAGNRIAGLHFPGYFLDLEWGRIGNERAHIALADGPHCRNASGEVDIAALAILADTVLATTARLELSSGVRLATVHLQMQFTGLPSSGKIEGDGRLLGFSEGSALRQSHSLATLSAHGKPVCYASGEFVRLDAPPGVKLAPLPWQRASAPRIEHLCEDDLEAAERPILEACDAALAEASPQAPFIEHFWSGIPQRTHEGARNHVAVSPHLGNRVGHVQGGILFGMAATCAKAAVPPSMMLSSASAWYISPGKGDALVVRSCVLHPGRTISVVRTEIKTTAGARVLEAVTHHLARAK